MVSHAPFAYCSQCGSSNITDHEGKAVRCLACGFIFYLNVAAAVGCILELPEGRILMVRRGREPKKGTLDLPGGFCDYGESLEQAVRREVGEELGLTLESLRYFASFPNLYPYGGVTYPTLDAIFLATPSNLSSIKLEDEILSIEKIHPQTVVWGEVGFASVQAALRLYGHRA